MSAGRWGMKLLAVAAISNPPALVAQPPELTVTDVRTLPTPQLARELLGERLGSRVIEAVRREYGPSPGVPYAVDFFTQPEAPWPRMNRICKTDVITVEFAWFDLDAPLPSSPIRIYHIEATSRYLAFPEPTGEPGTPEYDRAHRAACAGFTTALAAFRAPDAGDAQWLAAMESEWSQVPARRHFPFTCDDFADPHCGAAARALSGLTLSRATDVGRVDCPTRQSRPRDFASFCYRLTFPYARTDNPEWVLTGVGGMRDGSAPIEIRALRLEHIREPIGIP